MASRSHRVLWVEGDDIPCLHNGRSAERPATRRQGGRAGKAGVQAWVNISRPQQRSVWRGCLFFERRRAPPRHPLF